MGIYFENNNLWTRKNEWGEHPMKNFGELPVP
jgi:hypothetical protein